MVKLEKYIRTCSDYFTIKFVLMCKSTAYKK